MSTSINALVQCFSKKVVTSSKPLAIPTPSMQEAPISSQTLSYPSPLGNTGSASSQMNPMQPIISGDKQEGHILTNCIRFSAYVSVGCIFGWELQNTSIVNALVCFFPVLNTCCYGISTWNWHIWVSWTLSVCDSRVTDLWTLLVHELIDGPL